MRATGGDFKGRTTIGGLCRRVSSVPFLRTGYAAGSGVMMVALARGRDAHASQGVTGAGAWKCQPSYPITPTPDAEPAGCLPWPCRR